MPADTVSTIKVAHTIAARVSQIAEIHKEFFIQYPNTLKHSAITKASSETNIKKHEC